MTPLPKGIWKYAILLLLLLAIAAVATISTISAIQDMITAEAQKKSGQNFDTVEQIITISILALTMGFLLLAGSLGLWAIRSVTQSESRRRIGRFVDAMDYLSDGILALDRQGRITGSNPAARALMPQACPSGTLRETFSSLAEKEIGALLDRSGPSEIERPCRLPQGFRTLRFRSQPSEDINLVLVSDVTEQKSRDLENRQMAQLRLIGRVAQGVAHDFNNILCAITAHASLMERHAGSAGTKNESLQAILHESDRGARLAHHLLELSRTGIKGDPCNQLSQHIKNAVEILRVGLAHGWDVQMDLPEQFPTIGVTPTQIEQIVLNLGLLVADEHSAPGILRILAGQPGGAPPFDVQEPFAAVIVIMAHEPKDPLSPVSLRPPAPGGLQDGGVIQSVVRSMIEELGGHLDLLLAPSGRTCYRIGLPGFRTADQGGTLHPLQVPEELRDYVAGWPVLLAAPATASQRRLISHLNKLGIQTVLAETLVDALQFVQGDRPFSALILHQQLFGDDPHALMRAILKLRPASSILVLTPADSGPAMLDLANDVFFARDNAPPAMIVQYLIKARELAGHRKKALA